MAIGNPIIGKIRGNLGNMRYSVRRGKQVVSERSTTATQTNTYARVLQKVKLAPVVKFYQAAINNFFEFAFSNKEDGQTDYNAFVSYNLNISPYLTKSVNELWKAYPAPYVVSDGVIPVNFVFHDFQFGTQLPHFYNSLIADCVCPFDESHAVYVAGCFTPIEEPWSQGETWTVGEVSAQLKLYYNLLDGDKVTFLSVLPFRMSQQLEQVSYTNTIVNDIAWNYASLIINEQDRTVIPNVEEVPHGKSQLCMGVLPFENGFNTAIGVCSSAVSQDTDTLGERFDGGGLVAIIVTRYIDGHICANRSILRCGSSWDYLGLSSGQLYVDKRTDAARDAAVESYGYTPAPLDPAVESEDS